MLAMNRSLTEAIAMKGLEFYSTAAQIIPLFLILLGFQAKAFAPDRLRKWAYWIVTFAMTGEACALTTLYTEETWLVNGLVVWLVLIMLGALVFLAIVLSPDGVLSMRESKRSRTR